MHCYYPWENLHGCLFNRVDLIENQAARQSILLLQY
jgi:hypothetical protein